MWMRRQIEALIEKEEFENAYMEIERYERLCPKDADLAVYKFLYHVYTGEYEAALEYARKAVKLMPYSADVHYNYATALQLFERWEEAYEQLGIAWQLAKCKNPCNLDTWELEQQMKETAKQIAIRHVSISADHIEWVQNWAKYLKFKENIGFDILSSIFNSNYPIVAEEYRDYVELPPLYVAVAGEEKSFWLRDRPLEKEIRDKIIYVYSTEKIVSDTIEQMHRMRETDQYIWLETGELHKIADGLDLGFLMSEILISDIREITAGENSVKQAYDEMKIKYYIQRMASVDRKLAALFQYIEEHYLEDEILISLFADHGQGYLVRTEEEFLGPGRSKVAFMVRGNRLQGQSEELISTCDYPAILCKMAGIPFQYDGTDAHLPLTFGGTEEREYAISESIHVNDPYYISLKGKDFDFYLESKEPVTSECRIPLKEYTVKLLDKSGNELHDMENIMKCRDVCLEHIAPCVIFDN